MAKRIFIALVLAGMALGQHHALASDAGAVPAPLPHSFSVSTEGPKRLDVGSRMEVLVDPERELSVSAVLDASGDWKRIDRRSPNFGFTDAAHWFRFVLRNQSDVEVHRYVELPIPFINDLRLYHFAGGKLVANYELGSFKPFSQRVIVHQNFVMPLTLPPGDNLIVARLASSGTIEAPFRIWDPTRFVEFNHDEKVAHGALVGIMLVMVIYNFFIYLTVKDSSYLYYIGFVASYMLMHFSLTGYCYVYLWPNASSWNNIAISTFISMSGMFLNLFAISFLKLREASPIGYRLMKLMAWINGLTVIATFFVPYHYTVRSGTAITFIGAGASLILGYWLWFSGKQFARYFCIAWSAFLLGTMALLAQKYGMLPSNLLTIYAAPIGVVLLVLLLSVTLADQINVDRKLRMDAQADALRHEIKSRQAQQELLASKDQANLILEKRVEERTRELNTTLEQLTEANTRLQLLSTTDGLTQVSNRAFFDKALITEFRRALRVGSALSIIIFDIDHFKRINDTYGHIGGDECLREVARVMRSLVTRTGDVLARYGGEEFVVMLIDPDLESSIAMAEKYRAMIEKIEVPFGENGGQKIRFTASFGVACLRPDDGIGPMEIVRYADKALYEAKQAGRNCVRYANPATLASDGIG